MGSLVAEVARERKHQVRVAGSQENTKCAALTPEGLSTVDVVMEFTVPRCVIENIEACVRNGKAMVVGTTGWHKDLEHIQELVKRCDTGFLYAANFSPGVNLFLDVARVAAEALLHDYSGQIFERHHAHKEDAPSGTALAIQRVIRESARHHRKLPRQSSDALSKIH